MHLKNFGFGFFWCGKIFEEVKLLLDLCQNLFKMVAIKFMDKLLEEIQNYKILEMVWDKLFDFWLIDFDKAFLWILIEKVKSKISKINQINFIQKEAGFEMQMQSNKSIDKKQGSFQPSK